MNEPFEYAREVATDDVRETLDWLVANGFSVTRSEGGPGEAFGDVLLELERGGVETVSIVRDRSQWACDIGAHPIQRQPLDVLLTAMTGEAPARRSGSLDEPLADQLPPGVTWRDVIPALLEWLRSGPRGAEVDAAAGQWRAATKKWWDDQLGRT
jgi:hypothetical protein